MTIEQAQSAVEERINGSVAIENRKNVVYTEMTFTATSGWVFFWGTKKFLESNDLKHQLIGNCPIFVDRTDGSFHPVDWSVSIDEFIRRYEMEKK